MEDSAQKNALLRLAHLSRGLVGREALWERLSIEDLRALTPLFHGHINPYGQFALDLERPSFLEAACYSFKA
jgi:hypothetical protein